MKIASYNIMSGGFNGYDTEATEPQRLSALQDAIRMLDADAVGLVDTYRWDKIYSTPKICKLFGYSYAACINLNDARLETTGHNNGLTLLSNIKFDDVQTIRIATRDALLVCIKDLTLILAYFDDMSEQTRLQQVDALAPHINTSDRTIVMGDLNAIKASDVASVKMPLASLFDDNPGLEVALKPVIAEMLRGQTIGRLEQLGLIDADTMATPTVPTSLFSAKTRQPFLRLDYCLHTAAVNVKNISVPSDEVFERSSDHYPIVFEIED